MYIATSTKEKALIQTESEPCCRTHVRCSDCTVVCANDSANSFFRFPAAGLFFSLVQHGQGTVIYPDKGKYSGAWEHNRRSGHGTFWFADGDVYDGGWSQGLQHGEGTQTIRGVKYVVRYDSGRRVSKEAYRGSGSLFGLISI